MYDIVKVIYTVLDSKWSIQVTVFHKDSKADNYYLVSNTPIPLPSCKLRAIKDAMFSAFNIYAESLHSMREETNKGQYMGLCRYSLLVQDHE